MISATGGCTQMDLDAEDSLKSDLFQELYVVRDIKAADLPAPSEGLKKFILTARPESKLHDLDLNNVPHAVAEHYSKTRTAETIDSAHASLNSEG
jgi:hypothetical protein